MSPLLFVKLRFKQLANSVCGSGSHTPLEDRQACLSDEECEYIDTTCQNPVVKMDAIGSPFFVWWKHRLDQLANLVYESGIATRDKAVITVPLSM